MGFFSRNNMDRATETLPAQVDTMKGRIASGGNAAIDKATQIYNRNPKLIGGLALLASALLLNKMRSGARR